MMRLRVAGIALLSIGLIGCVSSGKYKKLDAQRAVLQAEHDSLQAAAVKLTSDNEALRADIARLKTEADALRAEHEALQKQQTETTARYDDVVNKLSQEVNAGQLQVRQFKNMLSVDVAEHLFFASGSATLKPEGQAVLMKVGEAMANYPDKVIRVVGHTDSVAIAKSHRAKFPTNWELSVMRATNVVRFLQEKAKIDPTRLVAAGRGPYEPVAPNDTPEGRQKNRRIEIMLIDRSLAESLGKTAQN
jgi:chemotaxis protein MotB